MKLETPELFSDQSFALSNYFQLSTSQVIDLDANVDCTV